jgi:hypothetical protein
MRQTTEKQIIDLMDNALALLYWGKLPGDKFLEIEEELNELAFSETDKCLTFNLVDIEGELSGLPLSYKLVDADKEECKTFSKSIVTIGCQTAVKNFINRKGHELDLFKMLARGTDFNKGKRVSFSSDEGIREGEITGYYFGNDAKNDDLAFPLRYTIKCDDGKPTNVVEDKCFVL